MAKNMSRAKANMNTFSSVASTSLCLSLVLFLTTLLVLPGVVMPTSAAAAGAVNNSCVFQFLFVSKDAHESAVWPEAPLSLAALYDKLLPAADFPTLNASVYRQFDDIVFNVSRVANRTASDNNNNSATVPAPGSTNDVDPYAGCSAMLRNLDGATMKQYKIEQAWIGFRPVHVPAYMRTITPQPVVLYSVLGAIGAVLTAVQLGYGLWYTYSNRGTLENIGNE